jgi:hypothetical protein
MAPKDWPEPDLLPLANQYAAAISGELAHEILAPQGET